MDARNQLGGDHRAAPFLQPERLWTRLRQLTMSLSETYSSLPDARSRGERTVQD
jgi:hypothetical protein